MPPLFQPFIGVSSAKVPGVIDAARSPSALAPAAYETTRPPRQTTAPSQARKEPKARFIATLPSRQDPRSMGDYLPELGANSRRMSHQLEQFRALSGRADTFAAHRRADCRRPVTVLRNIAGEASRCGI